MFEIFYLFSIRYIIASVLNRDGLFGNRYVLIAVGILIIMQIGFTYLPPAQALFGSVALDSLSWFYIVVVATSVLFLVELEKTLLRHFDHQQKKARNTAQVTARMISANADRSPTL